jgi:hypothetical protein
MVFRNVTKLHALIALFACVIAVPTGCSGGDFSGCKASRTCPPPGGGSGEGGDGDDTGGTDRGGTSSGAGGTRGGAAGTGGTDEGGNGGAPDPDDRERPTIVSFSPDDGDVDVERDVTATVTFSEALDAESVNETSVVLTGPDGDVAGTASVDGDVVTFVAEKPLYLLGEYTLTLGETIADLAGNTLGDEASVGFRVRDGRWSEPVYPFGETVRRVATILKRNAYGDAIVGMGLSPNFDQLFVAIYHADRGEWSTAEELVGAYASVTDVGIDPARRGAVAWGTGSIDDFGWSRVTPAGDSFNSGVLTYYSRLGVTANGLATAIWREDSSLPYTTRTQNLVDGTLDPEIPLPFTGSRVCSLASLERLAAIGTRVVGGEEELVVSWKFASVWSEPTPLASVSQLHDIDAASDAAGNILVIWVDGTNIWSRVYTRGTGEWSRAQLMTTTTTPGANVGEIGFVAGTAAVAFNNANPDTWTGAAVYQEGQGWIESATIKLDPDWTGSAVSVALDAVGNGLAVWRPDGSSFKYRRYVAGEGWRETASLSFDINPYYLWAIAEPNGTVLVVSNELDGSDNRVPWATRFE